MEWTSISLIGLSLLGGIWLLLWRHSRGRRFTITHHTVRCPLHDQSASIAACTKLPDRGHRRHVDVIGCSLLPREPMSPPNELVRVPGIPYYEVRLQKTGQTPIHIPQVRCPKHCLSILNYAEGSGPIGQGRCVSGVMDCLELEREATRNTAAEMPTTLAPWSYSG